MAAALERQAQLQMPRPTNLSRMVRTMRLPDGTLAALVSPNPYDRIERGVT